MRSSFCLFLLFFALTVRAQEKTAFQTAGPWKPVTDIRSDIVMVYGANDNRHMTFRERVESWRQRGYTAHFMTGIVCLYLPKDYKAAEVSCTDTEGIAVNHELKVGTSPANTLAGRLLWLTFENNPDGVNVRITKN